MQQKVDLYASVVYNGNGHGSSKATAVVQSADAGTTTGLKSAKGLQLNPQADVAQVKVETGFGSL